MSLAALMGIDRERYDAGNKFLSQDRFLANYNPRDAITFNVSPNMNTGIMGPRIYPYPPIIPQEGGDGGGIINPNRNTKFDYETEAYGLKDLSPEEKGITQEEQDIINAQINKDRLRTAAELGLFALNPVGYAIGKGINKTFGFVKDKFFGGDGDSGSGGGGGKNKGPTDYYGPGGGYEGSDLQDKDDEGSSNTTSSTSTASTAGDAPGYSGPTTFEYGGRVGFDNGLLADVTKTAEYKGWKKMYEMNPDIGKMHEQHDSFLKAYNTEQKAGGGIVGLFR